MATEWQKQVNGTRYEVRTAGNSIRLYTDGVFHTQWNPGCLFAGNVWDMLVLPVFMQSANWICKNALVLGVGGGAVINGLRCVQRPGLIDCVDLDATHLDIARRFFGAGGAEVRQHCAEAQQWLSHCAQGYQLIVEDLFVRNQHNEIVRAIPVSADWLNSLYRRLDSDGMLVMNCHSRYSWNQARRGLKALAASHGQALWCYSITLPNYENCVGVASFRPLSTTNIARQTIEDNRGEHKIKCILPGTKGWRFAVRRHR